jgi:hypothetical protein
VYGEALVCLRRTKERTKASLLGEPSDRSDCHSAVVPESSEQACTGDPRYGAETIGCHAQDEGLGEPDNTRSKNSTCSHVE